MATLARMINQELSHVSSWFNANKLTVHPDKSNTPIALVQELKFLGIIIHENLSWKPHITSICDKVAKVIGILSKLKRYLPSVTLKTLYNSLFLPYINHCNLIWASTYASYLEPLYLLQKKAIRIITFSPPRTRSKPLFSKLNNNK